VASLSGEARRVWERLRKEEDASAEDLAQSTDLPAATVLAALFELEEAGLAVLGDDGRYGARRNL
jgi:DNA-binding IclR family transcriptional regulator